MVQLEHRRRGTTFFRTLSAAKSGSEEAWVGIYRDLAGPVTGYLAGHGVSDPEDIASEVFLQMARDIHRFEGDEASFRSWVFVIAHRRMIDWRRAAGRRPVTTEGHLSHDAPGGDVEEEALSRISLERMQEILETLTDDQREVLALRVVADLSLEETATTMGKTVGAVKALQRRGIVSLRARFEDDVVSE